MSPRAAEILFKDQVAGILEETASGGSRFAYDPGWHEAIACCFPPSRRDHEWPRGLHPFFQHLGPEGWLREQQARGAHLAEEDDFGLLLRYGADCIGAVGLRPIGDPTPAIVTEAPATDALANPGRTVSGVQKKLLVIKQGAQFRPARRAGPAPYIAKFNSLSDHTLVRNEALSLRWASAVLGAGEVNRATLGVVDSEAALIVTRFDRGRDGEKLRLEDFAQILNKPRGQGHAGKYDAAYEDAARVIRDYSARPQIDLAKFFERLILYVLVGNCDAHLKNFSLLETPAGLRLSPAYDILNTAIYDQYDRRLALTIDGVRVQLDEITRAQLIDFARGIGLPPRLVTQIFADLRKRVGNAATILVPPSAEPPEGFVHRFGAIVSRACERLLCE